MIHMKNAVSGGDMWVDESRLAEYLSAGHRLAEEAKETPPAEPAKEPETPKRPRKRATK